MGKLVKISVCNRRTDKKYKNQEHTWDYIVNRNRIPVRTSETVEEYPKLPKAQRDSLKDIGGFVGGWLKGGIRKNGNIISRSLGVLDADSIPEDVDFLKVTAAALERVKYFIYSTHSHTPKNPRFRLVILFAREVKEDEYPALMRMVAKQIGIDYFDDTTYQANRMMYWASCPSNGEFIFEENDGRPLEPSKYLSMYEDWRDCSQWPTSSRQSEVIKRSVRKQQDPLTKEGAVGAFCRAYSIEDAITTFLSDLYEPSAMEGRYDYIPSDSSAGVVLYDDKWAYSHHASDPASDKLLNAFDLVRVHRFGDLDEKASFKAMSEFAIQDEKVKVQLAKERQVQAETEFADEDNWQTQLELDKSGAVKDTLTNISIILRFDPNLQPIVFNQFKHMFDVIGELPWPQVKPGWGDTDLACAKLYFERIYGIWSPTKFKDALLGVVSSERLYHPVKEYLGKLTWDGTKRLDTLLVDYLGAEDTAYVRAVTRKTLVAAVARIYEPGIKFDSILVLNGPQGIGKSTLFARLGKEWYSDSLSISDMKDKTAAEKLQGYWILELGELVGIKKMDVETVKSFISRTDDKYRQAYGVNVESHPRSCIIVGSTNSDGGFLRDITGNRRFWPVQVTGCGKYHPWELTDVDQIWAEAIERYNSGEELFLTGSLEDEAVSQQREAMEVDEREGLVREYLERLLPETWEELSIYERQDYIRSPEDPTLPEGTIRREIVSNMEIWCECFGKHKEDLRPSDSYSIAAIMKRIDGWEKRGRIADLSIYGRQRVYERVR